MRTIPILTILLVVIIISNTMVYATRDSLPACIVSIKKDTQNLVSEYGYKEQRWFAITKKKNLSPENYPDKMTITKFYNDNCQLVCTWTKGGIAGLNKVAPDTIEKEKIKLLNTLTLPDMIQKVATQKNTKEIQEFIYDGKTLYLIPNNTPPAYELAKKGVATIDEPYYDEKGKLIAIFKRATTGSFLRAQQWQPVTFKPALLFKTKNEWLRKGDTYILQ